MEMNWTPRNIKKLMACKTDEELLKAFPGCKIDSLTRKQRKIRSEGGSGTSSDNAIRRVLVIPDLQIPYEDELSLNAVEQFMADHTWDEVVYIGDFMDFDLISSHNKDNLRAVSGKTLDKEYIYGGEILDRHQKLCPNAKFTLIEGNHEHRIERYIDANPQLEGRIEVEVGLQLQKRGIKWVRFWSKGEVYKIGKACFIHGLYTPQYHARKHVEAYGDNVFYGHTHDVQSYSKELAGADKTIVGQSLGCLCDYNQKYMKGRPSKWQQAFAVFEFFPDGFFQYNVVRLFKHRFWAEGKTYQGK